MFKDVWSENAAFNCLKIDENSFKSDTNSKQIITAKSGDGTNYQFRDDGM